MQAPAPVPIASRLLLSLLLGSAVAACSEKATESAGKQGAAPKMPQQLALLSHEARIVADAELKRRNLIANLVQVQATVETQYPELLRCRVVHQWILTYQAPTSLITVDVALDADRKGVVGILKEGPPPAEDSRRKPIQGWNFGAEEAAAVVAAHPGISCSDSARSYSLRMDTVAGKEAPVWHTPYDLAGRPVAVDAGTRQLLEENPSPAGDRFLLTPLEPR